MMMACVNKSLNIHQTTVRYLLTNCQTFVNQLLNIYPLIIEHLSTIGRHLLNNWRTCQSTVEHSSTNCRTYLSVHCQIFPNRLLWNIGSSIIVKKLSINLWTFVSYRTSVNQLSNICSPIVEYLIPCVEHPFTNCGTFVNQSLDTC